MNLPEGVVELHPRPSCPNCGAPIDIVEGSTQPVVLTPGGGVTTIGVSVTITPHCSAGCF